MDEQKNDALVLADQSTSSQEIASSITDSITQVITINQDNSAQKPTNGARWSKKDQRVLSLLHTVFALAIKCYLEQLPYGWDYVCKLIRGIDPKEFQIVAIRHYKEIYAEDGHFWLSAYEKNHFHFIIRCSDRKKRVRVSTVLKMLGIVFRPVIDDELWKDHGVETVGNFGGYTTYLTHETEEAIRDGKELYDRKELVSNLTEEELDEIRDGYFMLTKGKRKASHEEMVNLDQLAYDMGYELKDFADWYFSLPLGVRGNAKMRLVRERYEYGIDKRIAEQKEMVRLFVYIKDKAGTGKTGSTLKALAGKKTLHIKGGKTGRFDKLTADVDAIVLDDDVCDNPLGMGDNYVCRAYRRGSRNPVWAGRYFVVLSNLEFTDWLNKCGVSSGDHITAAFSRVFLCEIKDRADGTRYLALRKPSTRGTKTEQIERAEMFMSFKKKFDEAIAQYKPEDELVDYADMIDPDYRTPAEQARADERAALAGCGIVLNSVYNRETERRYALEQCAAWFWNTSSLSLWGAYVESNPAARRDTAAAVQFIERLSDANLENELKKWLYYDEIKSVRIADVRNVIEWYADPFVEGE